MLHNTMYLYTGIDEVSCTWSHVNLNGPVDFNVFIPRPCVKAPKAGASNLRPAGQMRPAWPWGAARLRFKKIIIVLRHSPKWQLGQKTTSSSYSGPQTSHHMAHYWHFASHHSRPSSIPGLGRGCMCEKFHQLLAVGRWFPPGTPVSSTRKLISSSSVHRLDMTLAVAEALNPNKPNQTSPLLKKKDLDAPDLRQRHSQNMWVSCSGQLTVVSMSCWSVRSNPTKAWLELSIRKAWFGDALKRRGNDVCYTVEQSLHHIGLLTTTKYKLPLRCFEWIIIHANKSVFSLYVWWFVFRCCRNQLRLFHLILQLNLTVSVNGKRKRNQKGRSWS